MDKILKIIIGVSFTLFLVGCGNSSDERYLVRHPETLKHQVDRCREMLAENAVMNDACVFYNKVFDRAVYYSQLLMSNPQQFGKQILLKQMQLAELNKQITELSFKVATNERQRSFGEKALENLQKQKEEITFQLNIMLTLLAEAQNL